MPIFQLDPELWFSYILFKTMKRVTQNLLHPITIVHRSIFSQNWLSGTFQAYDYGSSEIHLKKYGTETPPMYDTEKIKTPVVLWYAEADGFLNPKVQKCI